MVAVGSLESKNEGESLVEGLRRRFTSEKLFHYGQAAHLRCGAKGKSLLVVYRRCLVSEIHDTGRAVATGHADNRLSTWETGCHKEFHGL